MVSPQTTFKMFKRIAWSLVPFFSNMSSFQDVVEIVFSLLMVKLLHSKFRPNSQVNKKFVKILECSLFLQILPPVGYLGQPATSFANKFVNLCVNRVRICPISVLLYDASYLEVFLNKNLDIVFWRVLVWTKPWPNIWRTSLAQPEMPNTLRGLKVSFMCRWWQVFEKASQNP